MTSPFGYVPENERGFGEPLIIKVDKDRIGRDYRVITKDPEEDNPCWARARTFNPVLISAAREREFAARKRELSVVHNTEERVLEALDLTDKLDGRTKHAFKQALRKNIDEFRKLLVLEIAPVVLAFPTAVDAATEDLRDITQDENLQLDTMGVPRQIARASRIKLVKGVASLMQVHPSLLLSEFSKDITIQELKTLLDSMGE